MQLKNNAYFKQSKEEKKKYTFRATTKLMLMTFIYGVDLTSLRWLSNEVTKEITKRDKKVQQKEIA